MSADAPFTDPARIPAGMTVTALGDVHGHLELMEPYLREVEDRAARRSDRHHVLVVLGDMIDRGPDSAGVVARLIAGVPGCQLVALRGNHEEAMLEFLDGAPVGRAWLDFGGIATLHSYGIQAPSWDADGLEAARAELMAKLPPGHLDFLRRLSLHAVIGDYLFVHAGLRPGRSIEEQSEEDLVWIREPFLTSGVRFGKKVVHGHTPVGAPDFRTNRINLDTGAYATGRLTAAVFEDEFVSLL